MTDHTAGPPSSTRTGDADRVWQTFEQLPIILGGFDGPSHVFDAANAAYRAFMGRAEPIGSSALDLFPELEQQELYTTFDRVRRTGVPEHQREWRFQSDISGTGELQEFYLDMTVGPRRGADGSISGLTLWAIDVTERVRERQAAQRAAAAADERYQAAREVVLEIQRALLPATVPVLPGVDVASRYLVASRDQAAGGDWFDVVPLPNGFVALVVGDIVGHGVAASSAMGQLRSVLATVLLETGELAQAVSWADRMATRSAVMRAATVCIVVLDPVGGDIRYITCGHPRPLVIEPDGSTRFLPVSGAGPLGTGADLHVVTGALGVGDVLLLYTDGLVERPGQTLEVGMAALKRVAGNAVDNRVMPLGAARTAAERVCQQGVELLTRLGYDDDVTALAVQRRASPVGRLRAEVPAEPTAVTDLRSHLAAWLRPLEVSPHDDHVVQLAVTELVANVVEHAYGAEHVGSVRLEVALDAGGVLQVEVGDNGRWREPDGLQVVGGRGLWMASAGVDELRIAHGGAHASRNRPDRLSDAITDAGRDVGTRGTVVTLRHHLTRRTALAAEPTAPHESRFSMQFDAHVDEGPPRVVTVFGPVDAVTAGDFATSLDAASRGGVRPVVVDMSEAEVLASAGVRVLFLARDAHAVHGHLLRIIARPGSPAQQVLDLVGLSHAT